MMKLRYSFYTGNTTCSVDTGKGLVEFTVLQTVVAKCTWLKHDWVFVVDEAADFTGCAWETREGIVSPPCESLGREAIFT